MDCIICGADTTEVTETISMPAINYRRRKCKTCNTAFFTEEVVGELDSIKVIFAKRSAERVKVARARAKGVEYEPHYESTTGKPTRPTQSLFEVRSKVKNSGEQS